MLRSRRSSVLSSLSLVFILTFVAASALAQGARAVPLADGVVVDAEGLVAYVMSPRPSLDAVELRGGATLWSAEVAAKPLLAVGDLLIAQAEAREAGRLDIVTFDLRDGSPGRLKAVVELPSGVTARLKDEPNRSFRLRAALEDGKVVLTWTAKSGADELQGYLPSPDEGRAPSVKSYRSLEGAAAIDLATGLVQPVTAKSAGSRPLDVVNVRIAGAKGRLYTSADGRHVLASERQQSADPFQSYRWTIYERATKERLGELAQVSSTAPFLVADSSLVYLSQPYFQRQGDDIVDVPMQVRAIDLASGVELWAKAVSNPRFTGPLPP